ncbi:MAG: hypothetical protein LBR18_05715 [Tannerella sp.]|nr:hypothetical protein [Tannerella sp.]
MLLRVPPQIRVYLAMTGYMKVWIASCLASSFSLAEKMTGYTSRLPAFMPSC